MIRTRWVEKKIIYFSKIQGRFKPEILRFFGTAIVLNYFTLQDTNTG